MSAFDVFFTSAVLGGLLGLALAYPVHWIMAYRRRRINK